MSFTHRVYQLLFYLFRLCPIRKNKIVVSSYSGAGYGDNGKYIVEELLRRNCEADIVWLCSSAGSPLPDKVRRVKYRSLRAIYELATARVWIDNKRKPDYVRKRAGQYYIMTWHGGIAIKQIEKDAEANLPEEYVRAAKNDSKMADLFLAESRWTREMYERIFWYDGEIMTCGAPRQDLLWQADRERIDRIRQRLRVTEGERLLLYVPTFRRDMQADDLSVYRMDWEGVLDAMERRFGGRWRGLIRLHPNVAALSRELSLGARVRDVTAYPDVQELLLVSDCLITDYSSTIFDFGVMARPAFLLARDIAEYVRQRDFTLRFDQLPFSVATSDSELIAAIDGFDEKEYGRKMSDFYFDYCGFVAGGHASEQVADRIVSVIENGK
ncbi:CDP-glycerol glycerophosphotransferase family protein [uncultured Alistipes sp.]|uniref:CDP-glycerol glycerophosphotransferase family protein n=1 Tax=uncultured Alistipes sp. TaxID=538949 RepID=UPI0025EB0292|nr:CDP-glycerol glycerophosphotransferase family protein [uncultured Alistipes sp.]